MKAGAHVGDARHGLHGQLAEEAEHEVLQQAVLEHAHARGRLAFAQRPTSKAVHHRRPHLRTGGTGASHIRHTLHP